MTDVFLTILTAAGVEVDISCNTCGKPSWSFTDEARFQRTLEYPFKVHYCSTACEQHDEPDLGPSHDP